MANGLKFNYWWFKSALSDEVCDKILAIGNKLIEDAKKEGKSTSASTSGQRQKSGDKSGDISIADKTIEEMKAEYGEDIDDKTYIRDSEVSWLNDKWIFDTIQPYVRVANESAGWNYDWDFSESLQFTKYGLNQYYGWHTDSGMCHNAKYKKFVPGVSPTNEKGDRLPLFVDNDNLVGKIRKLSVTVNLTKPGEYEGGNLKFDFGPHSEGKRFHECEEIRPRGSIIVFPSFLHHQVTPVTKGTRYSLVMWNCGRPFR